jgi:PfaB family protein
MDRKIAIVGMEAIFGPDKGLDAFDRTIFDGLQQEPESSPESGRKVRSGTKSECKEHYLSIPDGSEAPSPLSLMLAAVEGALRRTRSDCAREAPKEIPLIIVCEAKLPDPEPWQGRLIREDSVPLALKTAQDLLSDRKVRGVLLAAVRPRDRGTNASGSTPGPGGAGAILLKRFDQAKKDEDRVFATIDAIATETSRLKDGEEPLTEEVARTCTTALELAGVGRAEIGYIEASGVGVEEQDPGEIKGLVKAYGSKVGGLTCAMGNVQVNIGDCSVASLLGSIIKVALCLYHRYIPAIPGWAGPKNDELWRESPFYLATESRPWFLASEHGKRVAAVSHIEGRQVTHLILSEEARQRSRPNRYLAVVAPYCVPLAGEGPGDLTKQLDALSQAVEKSCSLVQPAKENLDAYRRKSRAAHALMVVGHNREELAREIRFMRKGVAEAFEKGTELKTPKGSFFTARPLGEEGKLAFVYPGVGSAYVGLGQSLFHLFPELYDRFSGVTPRMGEVLQEKELYPRTRQRLTEDEIWKRELKLRKDILTIGECGTGFFILFTMILRDVFKVTPHCALGYSLGEPGMIASLGVWEEPGRLADRFQESPTFREHLSGPLAAVRKYWNLSESSDDTPTRLWDSFTLQATPSRVREAIEGEERVYLTIINSPEEVVIAGEPESCRRVIKRMGCKHYPLGLELAIHCGPTRLEYDRIVELYTLPVRNNPGIKFYSSSCYKPIPLRSKAVAHSIAKAYSEPVDFPRLVNQAYEDGARLFIELGSRKFCCNLIDNILAGKDHLAMAINVKGTKDQASLVRVLAQLVSHRVPADLSPLF